MGTYEHEGDELGVVVVGLLQVEEVLYHLPGGSAVGDNSKASEQTGDDNAFFPSLIRDLFLASF